MARPVAFLSDFGLDDEFVGVCDAVVARISPSSRMIDITHGIAPQDVLRGALVLANAAPFLPEDVVVLAVVDPGVGSERRPVAIRTGSGAFMVGPDNGLLGLASDRLGGVTEAVVIESPDVILQPTSATFHGRDVFAPAAAHLAAGMPLDRLGPTVEPPSLARLAPPGVRTADGLLSCTVIGVDRFGNAQLSAAADDLRRAGLAGEPLLSVGSPSDRSALRMVRTFADVATGEAALVVDSSGWLTICVNRGSAARAFGLSPGSAVELRPARG